MSKYVKIEGQRGISKREAMTKIIRGKFILVEVRPAGGNTGGDPLWLYWLPQC